MYGVLAQSHGAIEVGDMRSVTDHKNAAMQCYGRVQYGTRMVTRYYSGTLI